MTAIRNKDTGKWVHGGPRDTAPAPQFLQLETIIGPEHRGAYLVRIDAITEIQQRHFGYHVSIDGRDEPIVIQEYEYEHLMEILTDAGMVTMPPVDVERI